MRQNGKKSHTALKIAAGLVLTAVIVYFTFTSMGSFDIASLLQNRFNWWFAAASALCFDLSTLVRGLVYPYGIEPEISVFAAWRITAVGNAANMVLPLRMGEGIRLALFPKGYSAVRRLRLTVIPAAFDLGAVLLFSVAAIFFAGFKNPGSLRMLSTATLIFAVVCAAAVLLFFAFRSDNSQVRRLFGVRRRRDDLAPVLRMALWVLLAWVLMLLSVWFGLLAFRFGPIHSLRLALAAFAAMNLIMLIPSSPGGIGLFESSVIFGLSGLGVATDPAKAVGLLLHLIQYAGLLPLALLLYASGLSVVRRFAGRIIRRFRPAPRFSRTR